MPTSTQIIGSFDSCQALTLHLTAVFFLILQLVQWPGATSDNRKLNSSSGQCPAARCPTHLVVPWFHQSMNQRCLGLCGATYHLAFSCDEHISARARWQILLLLFGGAKDAVFVFAPPPDTSMVLRTTRDLSSLCI